MSGGVDSSVAALLTLGMGYECIGATMKLFDNDDIGESREKTCCSLSDVEDARSVAASLGMKYYVFNFSECFGECVIDRFVDDYEHGRTPNPCIDCNKYLKFDKMFLRARELGLDTLIMGIRNEKAIREALSIPETELLGAVIAVGYRAINPDKPKRKTVDDILKLF